MGTDFRPLVIFHGGCRDGFGAAWAARKAHPDAEFIPYLYHMPPPDVKGRFVFVLDFSFGPEVLKELADQANFISLWDHHKTAIEQLKDFKHPKVDFKFALNKSGAGITWDALFPDQRRPWFLDYIEDRDLWNWKLAGSRAINLFIDSYPMDFEVFDHWESFDGYDLDAAQAEGEAILRFQTQMVEILVAKAKEVTIHGHRVLAVNSPVLASEVGNKISQNRPFGIVWHQKASGQYSYSFRSADDGLDVSKIAELFGGGGHYHAAAAETEIFLL
jgi:oligoribonuclease NrnB/cAMP/cGMP phosphodiesterase (DHH superfamily)